MHSSMNIHVSWFEIRKSQIYILKPKSYSISFSGLPANRSIIAFFSSRIVQSRFKNTSNSKCEICIQKSTHSAINAEYLNINSNSGGVNSTPTSIIRSQRASASPSPSPPKDIHRFKRAWKRGCSGLLQGL